MATFMLFFFFVLLLLKIINRKAVKVAINERHPFSSKKKRSVFQEQCVLHLSSGC